MRILLKTVSIGFLLFNISCASEVANSPAQSNKTVALSIIDDRGVPFFAISNDLGSNFKTISITSSLTPYNYASLHISMPKLSGSNIVSFGTDSGGNYRLDVSQDLWITHMVKSSLPFSIVADSVLDLYLHNNTIILSQHLISNNTNHLLVSTDLGDTFTDYLVPNTVLGSIEINGSFDGNNLVFKTLDTSSVERYYETSNFTSFSNISSFIQQYSSCPSTITHFSFDHGALLTTCTNISYSPDLSGVSFLDSKVADSDANALTNYSQYDVSLSGSIMALNFSRKETTASLDVGDSKIELYLSGDQGVNFNHLTYLLPKHNYIGACPSSSTCVRMKFSSYQGVSVF